MKTLPPSIAVWLATVAHVRHEHTDYEKLLAEGYDRDSARFFVIDAINEVLTRWRATRLLDPDDEEIVKRGTTFQSDIEIVLGRATPTLSQAQDSDISPRKGESEAQRSAR